MTITQFIRQLPAEQGEMVTVLRAWILDVGQHIKEHLSRNSPTFDFYGPLCSLRTAENEGVELCFHKGSELMDRDLLEARGRKKARSFYFYSVAQLEEHEDTVRRLLNEAAILNEYHFKRKRRK